MLVRPQIIILPLMGLLLFCTLQAANRGLASVVAYPGNAWLYQWQEDPASLDPAQWNLIRGYLEDSLNYHPNNPEVLFNLGSTYEGEYLYSLEGDEAAVQARRQARDYYLKALALQPTWPYFWIKLGLVNYSLGLVDEAYFKILNNADHFGPWEPGVQYLLIDIGLHQWRTMTDEQRKLIVYSIDKNMAIKNTRVSVLQLALKYGMINELCRYNGNYLAQVLECQ